MGIQITEKNLRLANRIIAALGGVTKLAEELGVSQSAVSHWLKRGVPENFKTRRALEHLITKRIANSEPMVRDLWDG